MTGFDPSLLTAKQSKVVNGMDFAIFLKLYLVSLSVCFMVGRQLKRSTIAKTIALVSSTGLKRELLVITSFERHSQYSLMI
jgi:hypothetical protein